MGERFLPIYGAVVLLQSGSCKPWTACSRPYTRLPVAYLADCSTKKPFATITFVFFTLFPRVLWYRRSFEWRTLAFFRRLHSTLGYLSPIEYEKERLQNAA